MSLVFSQKMKMKPFFCRFEVSTLASVLAIVDVLRAMIVSALLIGLFCGTGLVYLEKLEERKYENTSIRVDYYRNREVLVACIFIGVAICGVEILMAVALDNILQKSLGKASLVWLTCALLGILVRGAFYVYLWKNQVYLGFDRLHELTPSVKRVAHVLFLSGFAYEVVKVVQLITGVAAYMEIQGNNQNKAQVAPRRIAVGMIGGARRWVD